MMTEACGYKELVEQNMYTKVQHSWAPVAHAYNPSYSGGSQFEASLNK
jgi:hypothetical protein